MQSKTTSIIRRAAVFGTGIVLGLSAMSGVASAAPAGPHASQTTFTEDTDTNDNTTNNQADDGDNRHPSGKDRSVEHGGSGNQGKAQSNPDNDGHGPDRYAVEVGADQPEGEGGVDLHDQDGNNGCGNDDDFEDDNEGWCGRPQPAPAAEVDVDALAVQVDVPAVLPAVVAEVVTPAAQVLAVQAEAPQAAAVAIEVAAPQSRVAEVLGVSIEKPTTEAQVLGVSHERGALARTGLELTHFLVAAVALLALGLGMKRFSRTA